MVSLTGGDSALTILDTSQLFGLSIKLLNGPSDAAAGRPGFLLGSLRVGLPDMISNDIIRSGGSKRSGGPAVLGRV